MINFLKKIWHDPVWSKVIATTIIAAIALLSQHFYPWMDLATKIAISSYMFISQSSFAPNWLLLIMGICTVIVIGILRLVIWQSYKPIAVTPNWRVDYRQDIFWNIMWRWEYKDNGLPEDIYSFCPNCDFQESYQQLENKLIRFIQQKIRNNHWIKKEVS